MSMHEQFAEDLALYALGSLDGVERHTLEKHLEGCASCRRELELLRGDLSLLALTTAGPKPPARARQRLMAAVANEPRCPIVKPASEPGQRSRWSAFGWPALRWVAAAALIVVGIGLLRQNSLLQQDLSSLRVKFADQGVKLDEATQTVATLLDPEATKIELIAVGNKPQPRGKAIYQRRNRNLIFLASNLPPLPADNSIVTLSTNIRSYCGGTMET